MSLKGLVIGAALLAVTSGAQAAQVSLEPGSKTVNVGDVFSLTIQGSGFVDNLDGGGLDLSFDSTVLHLNGPAAIDPSWEFGSDGGTVGPGTLKDLVFNTFIHSINGTFPIATLSFTALQAAVNSQVTLGLNGGPSENPFGSGGNVVAVGFSPASITVQAVPLPAAVWLLLSGLGAALAKRRKAA